jgi:hypothetical protein
VQIHGLAVKTKKITPVKKKIGCWVEMTFDAVTERFGVRWLRVKDGFGGRGDREDWVADIPHGCLSVHDYHWNGDGFGPDYGSFDGAIRGETKLMVDSLHHRENELRERLRKIQATVEILEKSISVSDKPKRKAVRK